MKRIALVPGTPGPTYLPALHYPGCASNIWVKASIVHPSVKIAATTPTSHRENYYPAHADK